MTERTLFRRGCVALATVLTVALLDLAGPAPAAATPPPAPEAGTADWRMVSAGSGSTCGIRTTGRLYCWGFDSHGLLGNGGDEASAWTPVEVDGGHTDWRTVSVGADHACGIRVGHLYCWGYGNEGQLGQGDLVWEVSTPTEVTGLHADWTSVSAGQQATCGIRGGHLHCWGLDDHGQLGNGPDGQAHVPAEVAGAHADWTSVSIFAFHACGRRSSGRLYCWGEDFAGQLGNSALAGVRTAPSAVTGNRTDWTSVTVGAFHTCARRLPGRVFCWGADNFGQQGNGNPGGTRTTPSEVAGRRTDWASVSAAQTGACARRRSGRLYCWGDDTEGHLGDGPPAAMRRAPTEVFGRRADWRAVSSGTGAHGCALRTTARLFCWGYDSQGQLGNGVGAFSRYRPFEVAA
jgi:alpha-tubulin suppressor-like RCC1 family protein